MDIEDSEEIDRRKTGNDEGDILHRDLTRIVPPQDVDINNIPLSNVPERAKYIPIRLAYEDRKWLRLVESALTVSDYTSNIDKEFKSPAKAKQAKLKNIFAVLSGLVTAADFNEGQKLIEERNFNDYEQFFCDIFEIIRRYKIMNPEKLRSEYGKMIYMLQDATSPELQELLGVKLIKPIKTVYSLLESKGGLDVLHDKHIEIATQEILPDKAKSRARIQAEIEKKEKARRMICRKYARPPHLTVDEIESCLYSICDNNSFLNSNRLPIDKMISLLKKYFSPNIAENAKVLHNGGGGGGGGGGEDYSLAIAEGVDGARLSHGHTRQYYFCLQSLMLWREIVNDIFRLWYLAETDLLLLKGDTTLTNSPAISTTLRKSTHQSTNKQSSVAAAGGSGGSSSSGGDVNVRAYRLLDTGQGRHRVQVSPSTYRAMHEILYYTQSQVEQWIGSSVIHLGDHNVPNALMFIDKYTQVSRILGPVVNTLEQLDRIVDEDEAVEEFIKRGYGGLDRVTVEILHDFFRHAFDGSGASNFYDAGSCIDGRLTSAWNWCSQVHLKPYYPLFKLTGFTGFDGNFQH